MIYLLNKYDYTTKTWKMTGRFKSSVSRLKRGYLLDSNYFKYDYVHSGVPVAPTCLAKWVK